MPRRGGRSRLRRTLRLNTLRLATERVVGISSDMTECIRFGYDLTDGVVGIARVARRTAGRGLAFDRRDVLDPLDHLIPVCHGMTQGVGHCCRSVVVIGQRDFLSAIRVLTGNRATLCIVMPGGVTHAAFINKTSQRSGVSGVLIQKTTVLCHATFCERY